MRAGDWAAAWEISDAVLRECAGEPCHDWPRHRQYVWDGRPLAGQRVLVRCYHGLGDTVMFIRYAPLLKAIAREVIVWAQPALIPLLRTTHGIDRLLPLHDGTPECDYDLDIEVMELAHAFRSTPATLPRAVPYFDVPPARLPPGKQLRVGLAWVAGDWDRRRNIPIRQIARLAEVAGIEFHLLQRGPARAEWHEPRATRSGSDDVLATAALMRALDLVVSVDSFPAHLAGALGVPTWTLLPSPSDWRWGGDATTPWYPTMRLLRQARAGDWESVISPVAAALAARASDRTGNR